MGRPYLGLTITRKGSDYICILCKSHRGQNTYNSNKQRNLAIGHQQPNVLFCFLYTRQTPSTDGSYFFHYSVNMRDNIFKTISADKKDMGNTWLASKLIHILVFLHKRCEKFENMLVLGRFVHEIHEI